MLSLLSSSVAVALVKLKPRDPSCTAVFHGWFQRSIGIIILSTQQSIKISILTNGSLRAIIRCVYLFLCFKSQVKLLIDSGFFPGNTA